MDANRLNEWLPKVGDKIARKDNDTFSNGNLVATVSRTDIVAGMSVVWLVETDTWVPVEQVRLNGPVLSPQTKDAVNSPPHYTSGKVETIDYIEQVASHYYPAEAPLVANVIKYVSRAPLKSKKLEDLKKAQWYLNRLISKLENN